MNDFRIDRMLSELIQEVDYDVWKSLFDEQCIEDGDEASDIRARFALIVRKHVDV